MQTRLLPELLATDAGREADSILRACVHCGFCTATCPTYQVEGNELDSPRGRIYLLKNLLEGGDVSAHTRTHLDRCLQCRSCETTCPSGVNYHRLWDIGQQRLDQVLPRSVGERAFRRVLTAVLSRRRLFSLLASVGYSLRSFLPPSLRHHLPMRGEGMPVSSAERAERHVLLVQGCVQPGLTPDTVRGAQKVLHALGVDTRFATDEQCCGALEYHVQQTSGGLARARANIAAWEQALAAGAEAIITTATGCHSFVREYETLLADDPDYGPRAKAVLAKVYDIAEFLADEPLDTLALADPGRTVFHTPCSAQHGQNLQPVLQTVLARLGYQHPPVTDSHLCCGSAGTYSLFQPAMATTLRDRKLKSLQVSQPERILTANIGCQSHLASGSDRPVRHWVEDVARRLVTE